MVVLVIGVAVVVAAIVATVAVAADVAIVVAGRWRLSVPFDARPSPQVGDAFVLPSVLGREGTIAKRMFD